MFWPFARKKNRYRQLRSSQEPVASMLRYSFLDRKLDEMTVALLIVNTVLLLGEYSRVPALRLFFLEYGVNDSSWVFFLIFALKVIVSVAIFGPFLFFVVLSFLDDFRWLGYSNIAVLGAIFIWQIWPFL